MRGLDKRRRMGGRLQHSGCRGESFGTVGLEKLEASCINSPLGEVRPRPSLWAPSMGERPMLPWLAASSHGMYDAVGGWRFASPLSPPKVLKAREAAAPPLAGD